MNPETTLDLASQGIWVNLSAPSRVLRSRSGTRTAANPQCGADTETTAAAVLLVSPLPTGVVRANTGGFNFYLE